MLNIVIFLPEIPGNLTMWEVRDRETGREIGNGMSPDAERAFWAAWDWLTAYEAESDTQLEAVSL